MARRLLPLCICAILVNVAMAPAVAGEGPAPAPAPAATVVLNNDSYVRAFLAFRTPMVVTKEGEIKVAADPGSRWGPPKVPGPLPNFQSPLPPAEWMQSEFDDTTWDRQRSPVEMTPQWWGGESALHTATVNSIVFLRWKFAVDDPAAAKDLKLFLEYVGGVAVYVNGKELTRANLPAGELNPEALAEKYPDDLYVLEGNKMITQRWPGDGINGAHHAAFNRRYRRIDGLAVPPEMLRKGSNVLAVRIHRAPAGTAAIAATRFKEDGMSTKQGLWAGAGLKGIKLTSAPGAGVAPNVARPKGVQVWNVGPFETVSPFDYGAVGEGVKPVAINAVRNGVFSARLAVSSDSAIKGLKVVVSEVKNAKDGKTLPVSTVLARRAEWPAGGKARGGNYFDGLVETIPAELPVIKIGPPGEKYLATWPISRPLTGSAVAPIWLTARVPKDVEAGSYEGTVTVEAEGLKPTAVPLVLTVNDWTMPDPKDFRQHHLIYMSTDSVAKHYEVPLWSDKHFELMGRSLTLMAEINAREVPATLAINFHSDRQGDVSNEESLVRWIKQDDGSYKYDFTIFDKYMDLVAKHMGKPCPLRVACWGEPKKDQGQLKMPGWPTHVSLLDPASPGRSPAAPGQSPATGKLDKLAMPVPGTEESVAFWKPVLDEVRKKAEARGWWDVTALAHNSYCYPPIGEVTNMAKKIWPDGVWSYIAHNGTLGGAFGGMPIKYSVCVWTEGGLWPRHCRDLLKPRPSIWSNTARNRHWDWSPMVILRNLPEEMINRGMDGVGDFGADLFPVKKQGGNGFYHLGNGRGTGGPGAATMALLAPGPDGPIATQRYEMFREGTEFGEAVLYVEKALVDKKIDGDLAKKAERLLNERGSTLVTFWYDRGEEFRHRWSPAGMGRNDAELLTLCAEVSKASGGK